MCTSLLKDVTSGLEESAWSIRKVFWAIAMPMCSSMLFEMLCLELPICVILAITFQIQDQSTKT